MKLLAQCSSSKAFGSSTNLTVLSSAMAIRSALASEPGFAARRLNTLILRMFDHALYFDKGTIVMSNPWEIAIWRLEMISTPLDAKLTRAQKRRIIRDRTKHPFQWPDSSDERPIGKSTLLRWLKNYRDKGFLGLMPKVRKDKGLARAVPQKIFDKIIELKCSNPKLTCNNVNSYLKEHYNLEINRSTYHRYMKQKNGYIRNSQLVNNLLNSTNTVIAMNLYCTKILRNLFRNIYITYG